MSSSYISTTALPASLCPLPDGLANEADEASGRLLSALEIARSLAKEGKGLTVQSKVSLVQRTRDLALLLERSRDHKNRELRPLRDLLAQADADYEARLVRVRAILDEAQRACVTVDYASRIVGRASLEE